MRDLIITYLKKELKCTSIKSIQTFLLCMKRFPHTKQIKIPKPIQELIISSILKTVIPPKEGNEYLKLAIEEIAQNSEVKEIGQRKKIKTKKPLEKSLSQEIVKTPKDSKCIVF